jgi:hypothetical protein
MTRTIGIALILIGIAFITYAVLNKPKSMQLVEIEYSCKDWYCDITLPEGFIRVHASELNRIKVELKREYRMHTGDWVQFVEVKR